MIFVRIRNAESSAFFLYFAVSVPESRKKQVAEMGVVQMYE
nr:MAG TPA: hypothetical protein [Caudoviricetes sp.]